MKELLSLPFIALFMMGMISQSQFCSLGSALGDSICNANDTGTTILNESSDWKTFSSYQEMADYIKKNTQTQGGGYGFGLVREAMTINSASPSATKGSSDSSTSSQTYSGTNIQVAGVDEADIVKTDGKYIYTISNGAIYLVKASPTNQAEISSKIILEDMTPSELFIEGNKLIVFGSGSYSYDGPYYNSEGGGIAVTKEMYYPYYSGSAKVVVYDIEDKENPEKIKEFEVEGYYSDSRMTDGYVYFIVSQPFRYYDDRLVMPMVSEDNVTTNITKYTGVYYFPDMPQYYGGYTSLISLNLKNNKFSLKTMLSGSADTIYMSQENLYIASRKYDYRVYSRGIDLLTPQQEPKEETIIKKIAVKDGKFELLNTGTIPGTLLNQFSLDEYDEHLRVATTSGDVWSKTSKNNVYILDEEMEISGKLTGLAPGEKIYSARFMGERCYLVTFKKVDPLFVIDLSDATKPKVLGKLKIPGYSDYLHPYDENHIIGIGKDAEEAREGDFAWYQGLKISLFDVTDVENPKQIGNYSLGDRGTDSEALTDHKAFLFDKEKNLLVIPVLLAEKETNSNPSAYGDYTSQGAYVFDVSPEKGIKLRGRITHESKDNIMKMGYYYDSENQIRRSLFIGDTLYTISQTKIKMNDLSSLKETGIVDLTEKKEFCGTSTLAKCTADDDCMTGGCSGEVCMGIKQDISTDCKYSDCFDSDKYDKNCGCVKGECRWA
jgi:inhibitor of cysteine peptidase